MLRRSRTNFTHVPATYDRNMAVVPLNRDRVPSRLGHDAAICGFALPVDTATLFEHFGFGGCHVSPSANFGRTRHSYTHHHASDFIRMIASTVAHFSLRISATG